MDKFCKILNIAYPRKDTTMKEIKIFLGSSITELKSERNEIDLFIRKLSDLFEDEYDVKLLPVRCENIDPKYTRQRKQEEYNEYLRECDLAFFIFLTKAGEHTNEEFEVAKRRFEESGAPLIQVYVIQKPKEECDVSLLDFWEKLKSRYAISYKECSHLDVVKMYMLLDICREKMPFVRVSVENDMCQVNGKKVLSLKHIPESEGLPSCFFRSSACQ